MKDKKIELIKQEIHKQIKSRGMSFAEDVLYDLLDYIENIQKEE